MLTHTMNYVFIQWKLVPYKISCCHLLFRLEFLKNSIGNLAKYWPKKLKEKHQILRGHWWWFFNFSNRNFACVVSKNFMNSGWKSKWLQLVYKNRTSFNYIRNHLNTAVWGFPQNSQGIRAISISGNNSKSRN